MSLPTFFFSYAREDDEDKYLRVFFSDLEKRVAQWEGHALANGPLGTTDLRIPQGSDWKVVLPEALSTERAFVMAETPLYYNRLECGKELDTFLRRNPGLDIDEDGALVGVRNIFRVRWLREEVYGMPPEFRKRIPAILYRIQHTPAHDLDDDERTAAIERYVKKGMRRCVDQQPHYDELLDAFASAIVNADPLPPGDPAYYATARNAFDFDWQSHFQKPPPAALAAVAAPMVREPEALRSVVAFHITSDPIPVADEPLSFADLLIGDAADPAAPNPRLATIIDALARAAAAENLQLFNVAPTPPLPFDVARLADQLRILMQRGVVTLLVVDPGWLLALPPGAAAELLRKLQEAVPEWTGAIIVDAIDGAQPLVPPQGRFAVPGAVVLSADPDARAQELRGMLVEARGRVMRSLATRSNDFQALPLLSGVGSRAA